MATKLLNFLFGKWFFAVYFVLGGIYFIMSPYAINTQSWGNSFFMTLGLMTGSDPYSFKDSIEPHKSIWCLAWVIHIGSWLLIPALISIVIGNAAGEIKQEQRLQRGLNDWLTEADVKPDDLPDLVNHIRGEIEKVNMEKERRER